MSHYNVSLTVLGKVTRQCPQITFFEEKNEPKQGSRTCVLPLQYQPSALPPGQAGSFACIMHHQSVLWDCFSCKDDQQLSTTNTGGAVPAPLVLRTRPASRVVGTQTDNLLLDNTQSHSALRFPLSGRGCRGFSCFAWNAGNQTACWV